jgi:folate-binding protein YgfZ
MTGADHPPRSLKERIHAFKIPIKNPYLLFAVKCFYFTAPIYAGYKIMEWTNSIRDQNLGESREKLLQAALKRKRGTDVEQSGDPDGSGSKSSLLLPFICVAATATGFTQRGRNARTNHHHQIVSYFCRSYSASTAQSNHFLSSSSAAASARADAPRSFLSTRLSRRSVISIRGPDARKFLNGLTTNDCLSSSSSPSSLGNNNSGKGMFTAFLNGKARTLSEALLSEDQTQLLHHYSSSSSTSSSSATLIRGAEPSRNDASTTLLIDVDSKHCDSLIRHLKSHRLRSKIDIEDVSSTHSVTQIISNDPFSITEPEADLNLILNHLREEAGSFSSSSNSHLDRSFSVVADPRMPEMLGLRIIAPSSVDVGSSLGLPICSELDYHALRFLLGVPEGAEVSGNSVNQALEGSSTVSGGNNSSTAVPLEWNIEMMNGVSFSKGCYLGQELVARTHFRGLVRRRFVPVYFTSHGSPPRQVANANPYTAALGRETEGVRSHIAKATTSASHTPSPGGAGHGVGHGPSQTHNNDYSEGKSHTHSTSKPHSRIQPAHVIANSASSSRLTHSLRLPFPFIDRSWHGSLLEARSTAGSIIAGNGGGDLSASGVSLSGSKVGKLVAWEPGLNLGLVHMRLEPYLRHTLPSTSTTSSSDADGSSVRSESSMAAYKSLHNRCVGGKATGEEEGGGGGGGGSRSGLLLDLSIDAGGREESLYRVCPILPMWWSRVARPLVPEE